MNDFTIHAVGDRALLVDLHSLDEVMAFADALRALEIREVVDIVPAARTVLVTCVSPHALREVKRVLAGLDTAATRAEHVGAEVRIDVHYDGADLAGVAELTGLSVDAVIAAHTARDWFAAFGGFAPGFTYLVGGDPRLMVPRLASPRTRVPAGSVALAGEFSAVYPGEAPGGWQLIGTAAQALWDERRDPPALIAPGDRVRFHAVREVAVAGDAPAAQAVPTAALPNSTSVHLAAALTVVQPGPLSLVQDLGRPGFASLGVTESGVLDRGAAARANAAVSNPATAAVIECVLGGLSLRAERDMVVAVSGAQLSLHVSLTDADSDAGGDATGEPKLGEAIRLRAGQTLTLGIATSGLRAYVAIGGGIETEVGLVLGSRSSDQLSGLGPVPLRAGQQLWPSGEANEQVETAEAPGAGAASELAPRAFGAVLRAVAGPRDDWFTEASLQSFTEQTWRVTEQSNRIGVRLTGDALVRERTEELLSEGVVRGSVQVPPSGEPLMFLADHPVTGGYPVIATVIDADLDRAAQLRPGDPLRFVFVDPENPGDALDIESPEPVIGTVSFTAEVNGRRARVRIAAQLAAAIDASKGADHVAGLHALAAALAADAAHS